MEVNQLIIFPLLLLLSLSLQTFHCDAQGESGDDDKKRDVDQWCSVVPHPRSCAQYLPRPDGNRSLTVDHSTFYELSLHAALDRAVRARRRLRHMKKHLLNKTNTPSTLDFHTWFDCEKLYANTVLQLNRTILVRDRTPYDFQTWLSAALTNLNMCRRIFATNVTPSKLNIFQSLSKYNVTDLISNCLAINTPMLTTVNQTTVVALSRFARRKLGVVNPDIVVAKDGSGKYGSVAAAVAAGGRILRVGGKRLVIYIKTGVYRESIQIPSGMKDVTLVGDGKGKTIITSGRSVKNGYTMITSATLGVFGDGFIARDLTIQNTYGPGSQAVALLLASDRSVVYRASIEGYQDTLCVFSQRQFFRECDIYGTIDFIFGNAAVVIQKSNIYARKPLHGEGNVITAQGRSDPNQNTGIVIQSSNILSSVEFWPFHTSVKTYLGRPWMRYSRTVLLQNYITSIVDPAGWMPWSGSFALDTLYYAEYKNTGPGSRLSKRVKWPGYHIVVKPSLVSKFTVNKFIAGGMWIPTSGTPFSGGF